MGRIYYLGGSPCSGKSTIAKWLCQAYDLRYYAVDDALEDYTRKGAQKGCPICRKQLTLNAEQIWMRDPALQCEEELAYYAEISEFLMADLARAEEGDLLTEGAAFLPALMHAQGVQKAQYLCLTPTKEFQLFHYQKREWVPHVLADCSDPDAAFANWMQRDVLFADAVRAQCAQLGFSSIVNDGSESIGVLSQKIAEAFCFPTSAKDA